VAGRHTRRWRRSLGGVVRLPSETKLGREGGGGVAGSVAWEGHGAQLAEELGRDGSLAGDECHVGLLRSPVEEGWRVPLCSC
jgi:hypothetical protein